MEKKTFSVFGVIGQGFRWFGQYWTYAFVLIAVAIVGSIVSNIFMADATNAFAAALARAGNNPDKVLAAVGRLCSNHGYTLGLLISQIVNWVLTAGVISMALQAVKAGAASLSFRAFNMPFMTYVRFVLVNIMYSIIVAVGLMFFIVPGIIFACRFRMACYYLLDNQDAGVMESLGASWKMTKGNVWNLIGVAIVTVFLMLIGFICLIVGVYVIEAVMYFAYVAIYLSLNGGNGGNGENGGNGGNGGNVGNGDAEYVKEY